MNRRTHVRALAGAAALASTALAQQSVGIVLLLDLEVDPAQETQLRATFRDIFRPAIGKQPGFQSVRLMKLRKEMAGKAPAGCPYRLEIGFRTEEDRVKWVETDAHQQAWPAMEKCLKGQKYVALLYDLV